MKKEFYIKNEGKMKEFAQKVAKNLSKNSCLALFGDFGSGKTFFTKYICKYLQCNQPVTSPSFVIMNHYTGNLDVFHFDLYRLNSDQQLQDIYFQECFGKGVVIIEWAEIVKNILPKNSTFFYFFYHPDGGRSVLVENC